MCVYSNLSKNHEVELKQEGGERIGLIRQTPPSNKICYLSLSLSGFTPPSEKPALEKPC